MVIFKCLFKYQSMPCAWHLSQMTHILLVITLTWIVRIQLRLVLLLPVLTLFSWQTSSNQTLSQLLWQASGYGAIIARRLLVCKFPPLSTARYSFMQLTEMERCRVTKTLRLTSQHMIRTRGLLVESMKFYSWATSKFHVCKLCHNITFSCLFWRLVWNCFRTCDDGLEFSRQSKTHWLSILMCQQHCYLVPCRYQPFPSVQSGLYLC